MKPKHLREYLQVLKTSPAIIGDVAFALSQNRVAPHWRDGGHTAWLAKSDVLVLKVLNGPDEVFSDCWPKRQRDRMTKRGIKEVVWYTNERRHFHAMINKRAALKAHIDQCTVNGMIGLVESGRDCDCVEYVHPCAPIRATVADYLIRERRMHEGADGPCNLGIVTPEEAENTEYESRDLALEAYEDGHPHHIVSRFP